VPSLFGTPATRFRAVAVAEALSWAGLLIGMFVKHVLGGSEIGVHVFGPLHGAIFLLYLLVALLTWGALRWSLGVALLAGLAAIPPFGSIVFERWATRAGHLDTRRRPSEPVRA
jgi:integral membrane protein